MTLTVCILFIAVVFSSVVGKTQDNQNQISKKERNSEPYLENEQRNTGFLNFRILNRDWNYWANKPNLFTIPTGNVGIGTDSPQATLDICDHDEPTELRLSSGISGGSCSINFANGGWEIISIMGSPPTTLKFRYGETDTMTLRGSKVGIGSTNPNEELVVSSDEETRIFINSPFEWGPGIEWGNEGHEKWAMYRPANTNDLRIHNTLNAGDIVTFQNTTGNVGIGTTNPSSSVFNIYKLRFVIEVPVTIYPPLGQLDTDHA